MNSKLQLWWKHRSARVRSFCLATNKMFANDWYSAWARRSDLCSRGVRASFFLEVASAVVSQLLGCYRMADLQMMFHFDYLSDKCKDLMSFPSQSASESSADFISMIWINSPCARESFSCWNPDASSCRPEQVVRLLYLLSRHVRS